VTGKAVSEGAPSRTGRVRSGSFKFRWYHGPLLFAPKQRFTLLWGFFVGIRITGGRPERYPMSMRTHAHEIIRTWTFYIIVRSLYHAGKLPWKELMINGFVLAKKGEKFSKSKGDAALSPMRLIEAYFADALRDWTANARLGTDT